MDNEPAAGLFCGREHILPLRIYYEDTDFSGVVYHANYVRYLERGRSEFIRAIGASHSSLMQGDTRVTFMVSALDLRFLRPARIDDRLEVRTIFDSVRGARLIARQTVARGNELILEASVENVCVDFQGRPRRPPAQLMTRLSRYLPTPATIPANDRAASPIPEHAPALVAAE
jgi:acyl-CoA thioester hydrolase